MITSARKFVGKHQHIEILKAKAYIMLHQVTYFKGLFVELFQKGLPPFWDEDGKLISQSDYQDLLVRSMLDHKNFEDMTQSLFGKVIIDKLEADFDLVNEFRAIGAQLPSVS